MTKLMLRNHKANFHRFLKSGLLAAPFILAGMAVTGGHVHAAQIQDQNNRQNISQQNVNNTPKNIQLTSNNIQVANKSNQNIVTNWNNNLSLRANSNNQSTNNNQNNNSHSEMRTQYIRPNMHMVGQAGPGPIGDHPWASPSSQPFKNIENILSRYESQSLGLQYGQACGLVAAASVDNPNLTDNGLGKNLGPNKKSIGIFTVTNKEYQTYLNDCQNGGQNPKSLINMYESPLIISGNPWSSYQGGTQYSDPTQSVTTAVVSYMPDKINELENAAKNATSIDNALERNVTDPNLLEATNQNQDNNVDDSTGHPKAAAAAKRYNIVVEFYKGKGFNGQPIKTKTIPINASMIMGFDGKNLTCSQLLNGDQNGKNFDSDSSMFSEVMNQIPYDYTNKKGYGFSSSGESQYLVKNGQPTNNKLKIWVLPADANDPHWIYPQSDENGNSPIKSNDAKKGSTLAQAQMYNPNLDPNNITPGKGLENGNPHTDSKDQTPNSPSENDDNSGNGPSGSGGGSGSGSKGGGGAAAAGTAAGGAAGGAAAGGGAAGGATGAGGAGGGTDGTAGGVAQGGNGNNDAAMSGPVNNDVIPSGSTNANNNNGANNNVVPESPIINNNDHTNGNNNGDNSQYDADVKDDNALIAIIGNLATTDQKNHGILADLIDKDENRGLNRQLDNDEHNSNMQTQFTDQNNSLAASIEQEASIQHNSNQMRSLEDHFTAQSLEQSMAQSSAIASLKASAESREYGYNPEDTNNPFEANSTVQSNSANNPEPNDISNDSFANNNFGSDNTDPFGLNNLVNSDANNQAINASASASNSSTNNADDIANAFNKAFNNTGMNNASSNNGQNEGNDILNQFDNTVNGTNNNSNASQSAGNNILNQFDNTLDNDFGNLPASQSTNNTPKSGQNIINNLDGILNNII